MRERPAKPIKTCLGACIAGSGASHTGRTFPAAPILAKDVLQLPMPITAWHHSSVEPRLCMRQPPAVAIGIAGEEVWMRGAKFSESSGSPVAARAASPSRCTVTRLRPM